MVPPQHEGYDFSYFGDILNELNTRGTCEPHYPYRFWVNTLLDQPENIKKSNFRQSFDSLAC